MNFKVSENNAGLIAANYGTIQNMQCTDCVMTGATGGAIVGSNYGTIILCSFSGTCTDTYIYTGALVGSNCNSGLIIGCSFDGTYSTSQVYNGALMGLNQGTVAGCYASGVITSLDGNNEISAVVGDSNMGQTIGCYSTASFTPNLLAYPIGAIYSSATGTSLYHQATTTGDFSNDNSVYIDGTEWTWEIAVADMNTAISTYGYEYIENTDESTKDSFPYVLVKMETNE